MLQVPYIEATLDENLLARIFSISIRTIYLKYNLGMLIASRCSCYAYEYGHNNTFLYGSVIAPSLFSNQSFSCLHKTGYSRGYKLVFGESWKSYYCPLRDHRKKCLSEYVQDPPKSTINFSSFVLFIYIFF